MIRIIVGIIGIVFLLLDAFGVAVVFGVKTLSLGLALCFAALIIPG